MQNITAEQAWAAYKPLLDLLGVSPFDVYDEAPPVPRFDADGRLFVRYLKVVDPEAEPEDWPTVSVGQWPALELAYEVVVYFDGDPDPGALWPGVTKPISTRIGTGV